MQIVYMQKGLVCFLCFMPKLLLHDRTGVIKKLLKVTVQFETERNGQNGIFNHMDRSEVKL